MVSFSFCFVFSIATLIMLLVGWYHVIRPLQMTISYLIYKRDYNSAVAKVSVLQRDLDRISMVSASWNLRLHTDKCVKRFCRGSPEWKYDPETRYYLDGA